jgi:hypothetical protein
MSNDSDLSSQGFQEMAHVNDEVLAEEREKATLKLAKDAVAVKEMFGDVSDIVKDQG